MSGQTGVKMTSIRCEVKLIRGRSDIAERGSLVLLRLTTISLYQSKVQQKNWLVCMLLIVIKIIHVEFTSSFLKNTVFSDNSVCIARFYNTGNTLAN